VYGNKIAQSCPRDPLLLEVIDSADTRKSDFSQTVVKDVISYLFSFSSFLILLPLKIIADLYCFHIKKQKREEPLKNQNP